MQKEIRVNNVVLVVSDTGDVFLKEYHEYGSWGLRRLKQFKTGGKCYVHIGNHKLLLVHRLVAEAFLPNPHGFQWISHKDMNGCNNAVDNLFWCTRSCAIRRGYARKHKHMVTATNLITIADVVRDEFNVELIA